MKKVAHQHYEVDGYTIATTDCSIWEVYRGIGVSYFADKMPVVSGMTRKAAIAKLDELLA